MTLSSNNPYGQKSNPSPAPAPASGPTGEPAEPPPAYGEATGAGAHPATLQVPSSPRRASSEYSVSDDGHGAGEIGDDVRRSMEADERELPKGWSREFDGASQHIFYVDTLADPPRAIWTHPYDDPQYINSLPSDHPLRAAQSGAGSSSAGGSSSQAAGGSGAASSSRASSSAPQTEEKRTFGRKLKDKLTNSTHDERVSMRKQQAEEERRQYQKYLERRKALLEAQQNGTYQQRFAAPTTAYSYGPAYGSGLGGGGMYGNSGYPGGYGYGRGFATGGDIYQTDPYGRYNRGYGRRGNGIGMGGAGLGMGAGLLGGLLVGDMLF